MGGYCDDVDFHVSSACVDSVVFYLCNSIVECSSILVQVEICLLLVLVFGVFCISVVADDLNLVSVCLLYTSDAADE